MRPGRPSFTAGWVAAQRLRLDHQRPVIAGGDRDAERQLYLGFPRLLRVAAVRPTGMAARTAFFDNETIRAIEGDIEQVVILGAGYDGRALRFRHGEMRWVEVDFPSTQVDKRRRLEALGVPLSHLRFAAVDLMSADLEAALDQAGHLRDVPSLFMCEGLFAYLDPESGAALCTTLRRRAPVGSVLAANFLVAPPTAVHGRLLRSSVDRLLALVGEERRNQFRPGDAERMIAGGGWSIVRYAASRPTATDVGTHMLGLAAVPTPAGGN